MKIIMKNRKIALGAEILFSSEVVRREDFSKRDEDEDEEKRILKKKENKRFEFIILIRIILECISI